MLKSIIKTSIVFASFIMLSNSAVALTNTTESSANTVSKRKAMPLRPSILMENGFNAQQGFNTFLQLDSAMAKQFFSGPMHFNRMLMQENPKQYLISFDMPGVDPHKINVSISEGILFVKARSTNDDRRQNDYNHYDFSYHVALPSNVNIKKVNAVLHRGVLKITIEKNNELAALVEIPVKEVT